MKFPRPLLPILALSIAGAALLPAATTYYVSGDGSDENGGTLQTEPFRTLQKAADLVAPGDTVLVMNGTYANAYPSDSVIELSHSGTADAWITFKAFPDHHPVISFTGWQGIHGTGSYIEINGLIIKGNSKNLTYEQALKQKDAADPACNGTGISLESSRAGKEPFVHHYRLLNNTVSDCPGGGIDTLGCDYVTIRHNTVFNNGWYTRYAESGISTYQDRAFDHDPGYHMVIEGNLVYNNHGLIPWSVTKELSDGNGIIIDDSKNTQNKSPFGPYDGRTLVANNVTVHNGGSGIHAFSSEHVDIVNNTSWHNSQKLAYGEIYAEDCHDVNIINNVCVAEAGKPMNTDDRDHDVLYDYNLCFGGLSPVKDAHGISKDPHFTAPGEDPTQGGFTLQPDSPAIDSGTSHLAPATDIVGAARPAGKGIDRGAYESAAAP